MVSAFGPLTRDGEWLTIRPLEPERVPDVVEAIVRVGGRIHAVDPARTSLEERFLRLFMPPGAEAVPAPAPTEPGRAS